MNIPDELRFIEIGLRGAGLDHKIETVEWGPSWDHLGNIGSVALNRRWAADEARRIATYRIDHPDKPVTLIGYSAGAAIAAWVAESLPAGVTVDRVIVLAPGVSPGFDFATASGNTRQGLVVYWSPLDFESVIAAGQWGTMDRQFDPPAASRGIDDEGEKLIEITWEPSMIVYGNFGNHLGFIFNAPWIRDFIAPWVVR